MNHPQLLAPKRVLMTADALGGVWTYSMELCRALGEHDVEVLLATMGAMPSEDQREEAHRLQNVELVSSRFPLEWMADSWPGVAAAGRWLLELERRFAPDVIHLNGYAHSALNWRVPKVIVAHSCVLSWWNAVKGGKAPARWQQYEHRVRHGLECADKVIAPTRAMLRTLERHYGKLPAAEVIHNGRDANFFRCDPKECLIFSSGRLWDEAKNTATLAAVASRLPWPVFVAGERTGPDGRKLNLSNVGLLGRLRPEAVASMYARAAIYALPARYEPFGLSVLEAALSGCALVLGDIQSLRELWADAALFVPPDDAAALERAILSIIENANRRRELAARARARAITFTPQRMAQAYLSVYADLMMASVPDAVKIEEHVA